MKRATHCLSVIWTLPFLIACLLSSSLFAAPWQETSRQMVVVITDDWTSTEGFMTCFEKTGGKWELRGDRARVVVGRNGLGPGLGLHSAISGVPEKKEGDKRAPAGVFRLESGFGKSPLATALLPYRVTTASDFWVDDSNSRFYNQWADLSDRSLRTDWKSAEILRRPDGLYDFVIVVGHNREGIQPGRGSAIFMHAWSRPGTPTIGCTAMEKIRVKALLEWLDPAKEPILIQAPSGWIPQLHLPGGVIDLLREHRGE
jgi:L,D-peptidoglycan transpeptidase YkuD (ErfK/YbiS/YcfS/YnhG family)